MEVRDRNSIIDFIDGNIDICFQSSEQVHSTLVFNMVRIYKKIGSVLNKYLV